MASRRLYNASFTFRGERHSLTELAYTAPTLLEKIASLYPGAQEINIVPA